jgi:hypothetical protein
MILNEIKNQDQFNKYFKKDSTFSEQFKHTFLIFFVFITIFILFLEKAPFFFSPAELALSKKKNFYRTLKVIYQNHPIKQKEKKKKQHFILTISPSQDLKENLVILSGKKTKTGIENSIESFLASENELSDILQKVYTEVRRNKKLRGVEFIELTSAKNIKENKKQHLFKNIGKRKKVRKFWTEKEIEKINSVVRKNERVIRNCFEKHKIQIIEKRAFILIQFEITPLGKIDKNSIKILKTNTKNKEFLKCIKKRIRFFRDFPKAKYSKTENYKFTKRWFF